MPIEIKELHIKINVDGAAEDESKNGGAKPSGADMGSIVALCVEEVMEKLREEKER